MRIVRLATEAWLDTVTAPYGTFITDIFVNPSSAELAKIARGTDEVRMFLDGSRVLAWSIGLMHFVVAEKEHLSKNVIPLAAFVDHGLISGVMVTDYSRRGKWHHNPEVRDAILNHKRLQRLLDPDAASDLEFVSYYDEAIVGPWHEME